MNTLMDAESFIAAQLADDPVLSLAVTSAWLDPLLDEDKFFRYFDETVYAVMVAFRQVSHLHTHYADLVQLIFDQAPYSEFDRTVCDTIQSFGFDMEDVEYIHYGIPMPAHGVVLEDPETYQMHPDLKPLVALFGVTDIEDDSIHVPHRAYLVGASLHDEILEHCTEIRDDHRENLPDTDELRQLCMAIGFAFSCTGNSSVDYDYETAAEMYPLQWQDAEFQFARDIVSEAENIMGDALAGLHLLENPAWSAVLKRNITIVYQTIEREGEGRFNGRDNRYTFELDWTIDQSGTGDTARLTA